MRSLPSRVKVAGLVIGIFAGPLALWTTFLWLSHQSPRWFGEAGWPALLLSIGVSVICIAGLPLPSAARVVLGSLYVPAAGIGLFMYGVFFEGFVYGDWL